MVRYMKGGYWLQCTSRPSFHQACKDIKIYLVNHMVKSVKISSNTGLTLHQICTCWISKHKNYIITWLHIFPKMLLQLWVCTPCSMTGCANKMLFLLFSTMNLNFIWEDHTVLHGLHHFFSSAHSTIYCDDVGANINRSCKEKSQ